MGRDGHPACHLHLRHGRRRPPPPGHPPDHDGRRRDHPTGRRKPPCHTPTGPRCRPRPPPARNRWRRGVRCVGEQRGPLPGCLPDGRNAARRRPPPVRPGHHARVDWDAGAPRAGVPGCVPPRSEGGGGTGGFVHHDPTRPQPAPECLCGTLWCGGNQAEARPCPLVTCLQENRTHPHTHPHGGT